MREIPPRRQCPAWSILIGWLCAASVVASEDAPGPFEITFKNGKKVRGELLSHEEGKIRFHPYDGAPFSISSNLVLDTRALPPAEAALSKADALAAAGKVQDAIALLDETAREDAAPELRERMQDLQLKLQRARLKTRDKRHETFRQKFDALLDRRQLQEALDLARHELSEFPDDPEFLGDALLAEYRIHRSASGLPAEFRSPTMDRLRKVDSSSFVLAGIDAEISVANRMQARWEAERTAFLAGALERAQKLYENFELRRAKEVLDRAIGYHPPPEQLNPLQSLLARVEAELAAQTADQRARELERLKSLQDRRAPNADEGKAISDADAKKLMSKRHRQAGRQRNFDRQRPR